VRKLLALDGRQVGEAQPLAQPARARRENTLGVTVAGARRRVERGKGRRQLGSRIMFTAVGQEEIVVIDIAAPTAQLAALVMSERVPVGLVGQRSQRGIVRWGRQHEGARATQRQQ